jgi:hypothetical protein
VGPVNLLEDIGGVAVDVLRDKGRSACVPHRDPIAVRDLDLDFADLLGA